MPVSGKSLVSFCPNHLPVGGKCRIMQYNMTSKISSGSTWLRKLGLGSALASLLICGMMATLPSPRVSALAISAPPMSLADTTTCPTAGNNNGNGTKCLVDNYIYPLIKIVSALVGIVTVISIVIGGIQYSISGDDPSKVQAAKTRIGRSLFALLAFIFLFALLQWLVPGGILNGAGS